MRRGPSTGLLGGQPEDQKPGEPQVRSGPNIPVYCRLEIKLHVGWQQPVDDDEGNQEGQQGTPKLVQQAYPACYVPSQRLSSLQHSISLDYGGASITSMSASGESAYAPE